jgi:bacterioferritin
LNRNFEIWHPDIDFGATQYELQPSLVKMRSYGRFGVQCAKVQEGRFGKNPAIFSERNMNETENQKNIEILNEIMELELAGVVRYTHYSLMVFGYNRIPIVSWLEGNATEGLAHAQKAGEMVTMLGGHPSLKIGSLLETEQHNIGDILRESLEHEKLTLASYFKLLESAEGKSVILEEYAREMIYLEEQHLDEVNKMLRTPGEMKLFEE